jgi:hypothetical protein
LCKTIKEANVPVEHGVERGHLIDSHARHLEHVSNNVHRRDGQPTCMGQNKHTEYIANSSFCINNLFMSIHFLEQNKHTEYIANSFTEKMIKVLTPVLSLGQIQDWDDACRLVPLWVVFDDSLTPL